jgi:monoamine oxidase
LQAVPNRHRILKAGKLRSVDLWSEAGEIVERVDPRQPDRSFQKFVDTLDLDEQQRRLVIGFVEGFHAADTTRIGSHGLRRSDYASAQMDGEKMSRVQKGYSALVEALVAEIRSRGGRLFLNSEVHQVRWRPRNVEVTSVTRTRSRTTTADGVIIALPLGLLKQRKVDFHPALPTKQEIIDELLIGDVVRITLAFSDSVWPDSRTGFIHAFEEAIPTWWSDSSGRRVTGWAGGPKAGALAKWPFSTLQRMALEGFERVTGDRLISRRLVASHHWNWSGDDFIRGAYSYLPVNGLDLPKALAAPVHETLFFAGEATVFDGQTGTVFGAFESGLRAAREVKESAKPRSRRERAPGRVIFGERTTNGVDAQGDRRTPFRR